MRREMCIGGMVWSLGDLYGLYEQIAWFGQRGFAGVDFHTQPSFTDQWASFDVREASADERRALREALAPFDEVGIHGESFTYDITFDSPNELVRRASVESLRGSIELAAEIGAPVVTVHRGKADAQWAGEVLREAFARSLAELAAMAAEAGVTVGFEIEADYDLVLASDGPVGITIDTGHQSFEDGAGYREFGTLGNLIRHLGDRVVHVHVHDYDGQDDHLAIGAGDIDFADVLGALRDINYTGMLCLELSPDRTTPDDWVESREALQEILAEL